MAVVPVKRGETVYLRLEDFTPPWRQAAVLSQSGSKLVLAVRVVESEVADKTDSLSFFVAGSQTFILVEGDLSRVRSQCVTSHRALEVDVALILDRSQELLHSETLQSWRCVRSGCFSQILKRSVFQENRTFADARLKNRTNDFLARKTEQMTF